MYSLPKSNPNAIVYLRNRGDEKGEVNIEIKQSDSARFIAKFTADSKWSSSSGKETLASGEIDCIPRQRKATEFEGKDSVWSIKGFTDAAADIVGKAKMITVLEIGSFSAEPKGNRLGHLLLQQAVSYCQARNIQYIFATNFANNSRDTFWVPFGFKDLPGKLPMDVIDNKLKLATSKLAKPDLKLADMKKVGNEQAELMAMKANNALYMTVKQLGSKVAHPEGWAKP